MHTPLTLSTKQNQDLAGAAIALGLPVFPCAADKSPVTPHGHHDASLEPARIRELFSHPRAALIAIPTGRASGIVVIDIDRKNGKDGTAWLSANNSRLPPTRIDTTPNGGFHLMFRAPVQPVPTSVSKLAPGVDVRGERGSIIMAPSPGYRMVHPGPLAELPDWLVHAATAPKARVFGTGLAPPLGYATALSRK